MRINCLAFALVLMAYCAVGQRATAVDYPYSSVGPQNASLSINSSSQTPFNNRLLGLNTNFPENLYGLDGYNDADGQALITGWSPPSLRFPHGVWSNFYDWEVDGRRIYDNYMGTYYNAVVNVPQLKYGYDGFKTLHDNLGFDVLHTWNINYDSPAKGVARLQDRRADGFDVSRIELGNETFWVNQRSEAVATPELYVGVAQAHSAALKAVDPTIELSVPVSWRTTGHHVPWNAALAADQTYYDAVTLHKYIRPGDSTAGLEEVLDARSQMIQTAEATRAQFPGKPIWLSEWSVDAGENAISVLGLSDTYLGIIDRPDLFGSAEYFQIHNHDPLVIYDKSANPKHVKTTRGAAYDILRNVFVDSDLLSGQVTSSEIIPGLDAASAKAVLKDGDVVVYAVNKSPVSVPFDLSIDNSSYGGTYVHEALQFNNVNDFPTFNLGDSGLTSIPSTPGAISLPPLSISVLTISDPPLAEPPTLIAGWDTWNSGSAPTASFTASGIAGAAVTTSEGLAWHTNDERGASADGDWGTFTGPPAADTTVGTDNDQNLELSNATTGGTITFTITNNGTSDIELEGFHFDAYAFRPKAARAYELSVSGGDITNGVIYTSADDEITHVAGNNDNLAHDDIDHSLAGLADNVLAVGESVDFLLAFSSGEGDGSGGHDLWIDNVAVTGVILALSGDFDGNGIVDGSDFLLGQHSEASSSGLTAWNDNYGTSASLAAASATVPEPSTFLLLGLGIGVSRCCLRWSAA
ncbi:MAG: PEP-CTERM sorting domain-containing protein [Lacipirellulaceae bacterium]